MMIKKILMLTALSTACFGGNTIQAQEQEHQHHSSEHSKLSLNHGKKWNSDAALRLSMNTLYAAFQKKITGQQHQALSKADFKQLGEITQAEIANIVANCKLTPEADAVLHQIIAEMMQGADVMTGKAKGQPAKATHKVINALNKYGRLFDHPNWMMLK